MRMVLVTGLSGAGKTQIIRVLEDIGFYCVDNLPPVMIPQFIKTCENSGEINETAVVVDTRGSIFLDGINEALDAVESAGVQTEILFLEATDSVIINRYKETRRTHPMEEKQMSLEECIAYERNVLQPISLLSRLACQALKGAPWMQSYSVVQCVSCMMGQPLYCSAADAGMWGERLW